MNFASSYVSSFSVVRVASVLAALLFALPATLNCAEEPGESDALAKAMDALVRDRPEDAFALVAEGASAGDAPSQFISGFLQDIGAGVLVSHEKALPLLERSAAGGYEPAARYLAWRYTTGFGSEAPDPEKAAQLRASLPSEVNVDRGIARWLTVEDGMCAPRLSMALYWMMDRAGDNDAIAEANLATAFLSGGWTAPDMGQHVYWLQRAAEHKEPGSMLRLALYVGLGLTGEADPARELQLIRSAAESGHPDAQYMLAEKLRRGSGIKEDLSAAADWFRKAAAQGHLDSMVELGDLLRAGGPGLERDLEAAYRYSRRAADLGNAEAMADAAGMLRQGQGTTTDVEEARRLYEKAAEAGNAYAAYMVGWLELNSADRGPPDFARAREWFEKAAEGGYATAMREIGHLYYNGHGVEKDVAQAFEWTERAAREGDAWAQNRVGWMLRQGIGIERDDEEAVNWFELAARNGEPLGHGNLAYHYANGLGVTKDPSVAFEHARIALKELDDEWVKALFLFVVGEASRDQRAALKQALEDEIAAPGFIESQGSLPEATLELFESGPRSIRDASAAKRVIEAMVAANREASLVVLARHYYFGKHVPFDLEKARLLVGRAVEAKLAGAETLRASIESAAAESAADRASAMLELRRLADSGDREAATILMNVGTSARGTAISADDKQRYRKLVFGEAEETVSQAIAEIQQKTGTVPSDDPTAEEFEAMKARVPVQPNRPPASLHRPAPTFPFELSRIDVEGSARVRFVVTVDGRTADVRAIEATHPLFGRSAEDAVARWLFAPGLKDGVAVNVNVEQVLQFRMSTDQTESDPEEEDTIQ